MLNCTTCRKKREIRRPKRWQEDATGPTMLSAVHRLMQNAEFSKHEWKAKATLASAVLAFSQRTSTVHAITDTADISVLEKTEEAEPPFEIVKPTEANYALKETVMADEKITSATTISMFNEVTSKMEEPPFQIVMAQANYPLMESVMAVEKITSATAISMFNEVTSKMEEPPFQIVMAEATNYPLKETAMEDEMITRVTSMTMYNEVTSEMEDKTETSTWPGVDDAIGYEVESCTPTLVYYRLMVPNWLRQNATWSCDFEGDDLDLDIKSDASNWENIFRIQILPACRFTDCDDITVKMNIGVLLPEEVQALDSNMSYMISDGHFAVGFQLNDPQQDYATRGPYLALEGEVGSKSLRNPNTKVAASVNTTSTKNPNQFQLRFKPSEAWGSTYCGLDEGHKIVAQYSTPLRLSSGLRFEMYRHNSAERYRINYVEFFVYQDSPSLPPVPLKCGRQTVC